jgi:UDP-N-acetylmuramoylalanine--D-glutamate ligase
MSTNGKYYSKIKPKNNPPQKVLIFGLGLNAGGVGSVKFFSRQGTKVVVTDLKNKKALSSSLAKLSSFPNIKYVLGKHRLVDFLTSDLIIKNPAIPWEHPFLKKARERGIKISTDTIIFFNQTPALIVGITGTKGKSTTAALLTEILKKKYPRVWLLGNIRESFLDKLPKIKSQDIVVAELSSFQLEDLALIKKSPSVAVITNIFADHLNRYKSLKDYGRTKANIFLYQKPTDHLIINGKDKFLVKLARKAKAQKHFFRKSNLSRLEINIGLAALAAKILGVPRKTIAKTVKNFRGLPGRLEFVGKFSAKGGSASGGKNRIFINDTTATNPTAVLTGLQFLIKKYKRPIVLIAGGQDKKLNYQTMTETINKKIKKLILLPGDATKKLKKSLKIKFKEVKNMKTAVATAYRVSEPGDLIVLSPGAASFNLFQNEFDRGRQFNQNIKKLLKT